MNLDCEDIFWGNDCFRCNNNEFTNDSSFDKENTWFHNYQLLKLLIELKEFFEDNKIDYQLDLPFIYESYQNCSYAEDYESINFADYLLIYVFRDLALHVTFCVDSGEELQALYDEYSVFVNIEAIDINFYNDIYAMACTPSGCPYDLLESLGDELVGYCSEYLDVDCKDGYEAIDHAGELVDYVSDEVAAKLKNGLVIDGFLWYEPYKVIKFINDMGVLSCEAANV